MAGAIVNPYAVTPGQLSYEDECKADSPLGLWMLDETSGTVAADQGSVGQDGDYGTTYTPTLNDQTIFGLVSPKWFNGDNVSVINDAGFNNDHTGLTGTATWEFLVNSDDITGFQWLYYWRGPVYIYFSGSGLVVAIKDTADAQVMTVTDSTTSFTSDTDYHIVVTYDRAAPNLEIWVNGVSTATSTTVDAGRVTVAASIELNFGNSSDTGGGWIQGGLCGVAFYSQVLSDARIADHYAALTA